MKKTIYFIAALAVAVLASCSNNDDGTQADERQAILLSADMTGTRASDGVQDDAFYTGEQVTVYITEKAVSPTTVYQPIIYTVSNSSGTMTPAGNIYPYFPTNGNNVDIYGLYPINVKSATNQFEVAANQDAEEYYMESDLMYGKLEDVAKTATTQTLTFHHLLTKVSVQLTPGTGVTANDLAGATIQLCNIRRFCYLTASTGSLGSTFGDQEYVTVTSSAAADEVFSAIIPPQDAAPAVYLIKVRLRGGDVIYFSPTQTMNFLAGNSYKFIITVNHNSLSVDYSFTPWENTQDTNGDPDNVYTGHPEL